MLFLPSAWTFKARLPSEARIPGIWDTSVQVISETGADPVCSFSPQYGPEGLVSVSRCCTGTFFYTDRLKRPEYGSKPRTGLTGRDFKDPRVCLRHHTID